MRKTAFLFPGQGAQNVGMGRSFYEKYDAVRQYFKTAQEVTGIDVASLCFEENEALNQTEYTQIAMYTNRMCDTARFTGKKDSVRSGGRAFTGRICGADGSRGIIF